MDLEELLARDQSPQVIVHYLSVKITSLNMDSKSLTTFDYLPSPNSVNTNKLIASIKMKISPQLKTLFNEMLKFIK